MENQNDYNAEEIFSKALRAGRRTYFFDVRETIEGKSKQLLENF